MTVSYPDVSNYNGPMPLQAGTVACFAKSSEGTGFRDAQYAHFKAEAARVGALFGAYHFLLQGDGAGQARWAFSIVGPGIPMMIDFEPSGTSHPTIADAVTFRDTYRALGGLCTMNYLPHWYWQQLGSPPLAPLADLALVTSGYTAYSDTAPQWQPYGGLTPAIWQWTDAQPYSGQKVDFNAYRGTREQLAALMTGEKDMPLTPADAKVVYDYAEENVTLANGTVVQASFGNLAHGAWVAVNDPKTGNAALGAKLDDLAAAVAKFAAPAPVDVAALAANLSATLGPALTAAAQAGAALTGDQLAAVLEQHLGAALSADAVKSGA